MAMDCPLTSAEPSAFEWWAEILIPAIGSLLTVLLAGVSVWIALRALRAAQKAETERRRDLRRARVYKLNAIFEPMASAWTRQDAQQAVPPFLPIGVIKAEFGLEGDAKASALADRALQYDLHVRRNLSDGTPIEERFFFWSDATREWREATLAYIADDSGTWTLGPSLVSEPDDGSALDLRTPAEKRRDRRRSKVLRAFPLVVRRRFTP